MSPSDVVLVDKGIIYESVQLLVRFGRSSGKSWYSIRWEVREPSIKGSHNHLSHWCWSMILGKVVAELIEHFGTSCIASFAVAAEDMVNIFFQVSADEASSINTIVLGGTLV